jgi:hypothetical protein
LRQLGKLHRAKKAQLDEKQTWGGRFGMIACSFFVLPVILNTIPMLLFTINQPPQVQLGLAGLTVGISIYGAYLIYRKAQKNQRHHLYDASLLFYPIIGFIITWLFAGVRVLQPSGFGMVMLFLFICLVLSSFLNGSLYLWVDAYEEQTLPILGKALRKCVDAMLSLIREVVYAIIDEYRENQKHQSVRIPPPKPPMPPRRGSPARVAQMVQRTVPRPNNFKKPVPRPTSSAKKAIQSKQPNNRRPNW